MTEETMEPKRSNKVLFVGSIIGLILLLVGAAFIGGRLLNQSKEETAAANQEPPIRDVPAGAPLGEGGLGITADSGPEMQSISLGDILPAPEIPMREPDVRGLYVSRKDDTITVGTGRIMAVAIEGQAPEFNYDGIAVEVLVTNRTELYEDTTEFTPGQSGPIQQTVRPLTNLDDLDEGISLEVWGRKEGDRIVAEIVVVKRPVMAFSQP